MRRLFPIFALLLCVTCPAWLSARGKNKINYDNFDWKIYESTHFRFHYYTAEEHLLEEVADMSEAAYKVVSEKLQHELKFKVPMIFFKTHEEFEQTNVFPGFMPQGVGAFAEPFQSRMLLPVDGTPEENYALITHELTHIFQFDMLYNNRISTIVRAAAPTWFSEGMASYVADDENNLDRMVLRDSAVNGGYGGLSNFNSFSFVAYRIGHAAFKYMEDEYGIEGVRSFLWQYRKNVTGNVSSAIQRAFDIRIDEFDRNFRKFLRRKYVALLPIKEEPDDHAREIRTRRTFTTLSPELSPSGDLFAAIIPYKNELDLVLISTKDGRLFKNMTRGKTNAYTSINVGSFDGVNDIGWRKDGNELVFAARKEGMNRIFVIDVLKKQTSREIDPENVRDATSPIFSHDGRTIIFSGNRNGDYDLFSFNRDTKVVKNLTRDSHIDRNPRLSPDGKELLYSSSRNGFYKVFALDLETGEKTQLTSGLGNDIQASYSQDMSSIFFSSDRYDDIYNIFQLDLETGEKSQYTNILTGAFSPQERILFDHRAGEERRQLIFTAFYQGRYRIYRMDDPDSRKEPYEISTDNFQNVKDYKMTTNLKLDPERMGPYRLFKSISISGANVSAGATDDGRFISNTSIQLSDTLANHILNVSSFSVSSRESYYVGYVNQANRLQWGASINSDQNFFVDRFSGQRQDRTYKSFSVSTFLRYPFSLFSRIDAGVGYIDRDFIQFVQSPINFNERQSVIDSLEEAYAYVAFSTDTVRYQSYGPQHGTSLDLSAQVIGDQATSYGLDFRSYREISRRSLWAFRVVGDYSDGDRPNFYTLGGNNNLRGDYGFQTFVGSRRLLTQIELRFPFVDRLQFPGFAFGNIRGTLFLDVGAAWFNDDTFNFEFQDSRPDSGELPALAELFPDATLQQLQQLQEDLNDPNSGITEELLLSLGFFNPENPNPNYLIGAYGAQISMVLAGLEVHWTWAKRTNFQDFPEGSRFSFWIGRNF